MQTVCSGTLYIFAGDPLELNVLIVLLNIARQASSAAWKEDGGAGI